MAETRADLIAQGGDPTTDLCESEKRDLQECEAIISRGLNTFLEVGEALAEIRDRRLYRETHKNFEKYCKQTWDLGRSYADKQIAAYETVHLLEEKCGQLSAVSEDNEVKVLPINEAQARPLTQLSDPEDQVKAWGIVLKKLNEDPKARLTASLICKAVKEVKGEAGKRKIREVQQEITLTSLLSRQFQNQFQVLLDIVAAERDNGWKNCKQAEVVRQLETLVKLAKEKV